MQESVRKLHLQQLNKGENHVQNTTQVLQILGGIDQILLNYLSERSNINITTSQLTRLKQLLETPQKYQQHNKPKQLSIVKPDTNITDLEDDNFRLNLNDEDTCLHRGLTKEKAEKYLQLINSNIMRAIIVMLMISTQILEMIPYDKTIQTIESIQSLITFLFVIPYTCIFLCSANHTVLVLILTQSFEFWYKAVNCLIPLVLLRVIDYTDGNYNMFYCLSTGINQTCFALFAITFVSVVDAYHWNKQWKIVFTTIVACLFVCGSIWMQMKIRSSRANLHFVSILWMEFTLEYMILSAFRILAIFSWKQAILCMIRYKSDKCVMLKFTASVRWKTGTAGIDTTNKQSQTPDPVTPIVQVTNGRTSTDVYVKDDISDDDKSIAVNVGNHIADYRIETQHKMRDSSSIIDDCSISTSQQ